MKVIKQIFYLLYEVIIIYYVYSISVLFLKIGFSEISRYIFFAFICIFLLLPLIKNFKFCKGIKLLSMENDYKINKSIKKLKNINKLDNPVLKVKKQKENLDNIIITNKGVFNIVKSNLKGKIKIENDNEWYQKVGNKYVKIESPIIKIKKFRKTLRKAFSEDIIYDVIVMMEDRVTIDMDNNCNAPIISYNNLGKFIDNYNAEEIFESDKLYDKLYPYIYENKDNSKEISIYNKYMESKWKYRGRFTVVLITVVFYIKSVLLIKQ